MTSSRDKIPEFDPQITQSAATKNIILAVVTVVGTILSSNGVIDFRAIERNEKLLLAQEEKIKHIDNLVIEMRTSQEEYKRVLGRLDIEIDKAIQRQNASVNDKK